MTGRGNESIRIAALSVYLFPSHSVLDDHIDIDVIIGGHSHSMVTNTNVMNAAGKPMVIAQMGKSGFSLGKVELEVEKK